MLLLVLILVLIAFGLLVVALLSGSVLWAWVSVAVSVGAAAVLLVDWLQRRAAVRAGSDAGSAAEAPAPPVADIEPVTEVIPVIPASGPVPGMAPERLGGPVVPPPAPVDPRFDLTGDSQETVVMPMIQPSGSAERPSGAAGDVIPSGTVSSPGVTDSEGASSLADVDAPDGSEGDRNALDGTAVVVGPTGTAPGMEPAAPAQAAQPVPPDGSDRPVQPDQSVQPADPGADPAAPATADTPGGAPAGAVAGAEPRESARPDGDRESATAGGVPQAAPGDASGIDGPTVAVPAAGTPAVAGTPPPAGPPAGESGRPDVPVGEIPAGSRPEAPGWEHQDPRGVQQDPAAAMVQPAPNEEPPEEQRDAAAAALVARLNDEVVVVDELPRYHVPGCRSLPGKPIIPLPVREAVELGFTPCGWCAPDRTLSSRHPATAR